MPIPANLTAGDSANWIDDLFTSPDGARLGSGLYVLTYELRGAGDPLSLVSITSGQGWKTTITPTDSAKLTAGVWFWAAILTGNSERITVARGEITIAQDLSAVSAPNYDGRSTSETALADAESALANLHASGKKTKKYTIGSRNAEYYTAPELIAAISYWRIRVANERAAKSIKDGLGDPKNLMVRFR